jgi:hypothetical protein
MGVEEATVIDGIGIDKVSGVILQGAELMAVAPHGWRQWFLRHGPVPPFVTYNCAEADREVEDADVERMLGGLRARSDQGGRHAFCEKDRAALPPGL